MITFFQLNDSIQALVGDGVISIILMATHWRLYGSIIIDPNCWTVRHCVFVFVANGVTNILVHQPFGSC